MKDVKYESHDADRYREMYCWNDYYLYIVYTMFEDEKNGAVVLDRGIR